MQEQDTNDSSQWCGTDQEHIIVLEFLRWGEFKNETVIYSCLLPHENIASVEEKMEEQKTKYAAKKLEQGEISGQLSFLDMRKKHLSNWLALGQGTLFPCTLHSSLICTFRLCEPWLCIQWGVQKNNRWTVLFIHDSTIYGLVSWYFFLRYYIYTQMLLQEAHQWKMSQCGTLFAELVWGTSWPFFCHLLQNAWQKAPRLHPLTSKPAIVVRLCYIFFQRCTMWDNEIFKPWNEIQAVQTWDKTFERTITTLHCPKNANLMMGNIYPTPHRIIFQSKHNAGYILEYF